MASFTDAKHFLGDVAADFVTHLSRQGPDVFAQSAIGSSACTFAGHSVDLVLGSAFSVGDILLMTHDIAVGSKLLHLVWEQHELNKEIRKPRSDNKEK